MSIPSGQVYLVSNAIVDSSYNHTIDFKNSSEQAAYWSSLVKYRLTNFSYIRRSSRILKVDKTLDELQDVNYMYFTSITDGKTYYCFVTNKEYVNDSTTSITFETDVLQTRMFEYEVKQSYVLQEHVDRWDANHKPIYSRTEEGLDYGSEYTVEAAYKVTDPDNDTKWYLAVCKEPSSMVLEGASATPTIVTNVANPYTFYLLPVSGSMVLQSVTNYLGQVKTSALNGLDTFTNLMRATALGEYVQQIIKIPYLPFDFNYKKSDSGLFIIDTTPAKNVSLDVTTLGQDGKSGSFLVVKSTGSAVRKVLAEMNVFEGIDSAMPTAEQWAEVKANPYTTERDKRFESKLLTHPYRYNILTDWKNNPQIFKNEFIGGDNITLSYSQGFTFNSPARYWIENYRKDPEGRGNSLVQALPEESPVVTDAYYSYMLSNKNQISANMTNALTSGANNIIQSAVGGLAGGSLLGTALSVVGGTANTFVNTGNMVRSENAKQKDLKNLPDTIINSNDGAFNIGDKNEYVTFYRMKICCEFEQLLADTFAMTGYTVKQLKVPNTRSRVRYNYVKTLGANIVGSFDQNERNLISQIFDKGVTFWHYNTVNFKPFDYSLENIETKLI